MGLHNGRGVKFEQTRWNTSADNDREKPISGNTVMSVTDVCGCIMGPLTPSILLSHYCTKQWFCSTPGDGLLCYVLPLYTSNDFSRERANLKFTHSLDS